MGIEKPLTEEAIGMHNFTQYKEEQSGTVSTGFQLCKLKTAEWIQKYYERRVSILDSFSKYGKK